MSVFKTVKRIISDFGSASGRFHAPHDILRAEHDEARRDRSGRATERDVVATTGSSDVGRTRNDRRAA